jgi:flagellar biosynthesis/type III secretory pathway chaperone
LSAQQIINMMEKLVDVHQTLNEQGVRKTEILKTGEMKALEALMKEEEATVSQLKAFEDERNAAVDSFLEQKSILPGNVTIEALIKFVKPEEQDRLTAVHQMLLNEIVALKQRNELNQQLIQQSLQFVNLSLNMVQPQAQPTNYDRPGKQKNQTDNNRHSLFDSKA